MPQTHSPSEPPAAKILRIQTLTLRYVAAEDRMCIDCRLKGGEHLRLWATRRLMDRLVPSLFDKLEADGSSSAIPADIRQSLAQSKAERQKEKSKAVAPPEDTPEWLVSGVKLADTPNGIRVAFRTKSTDEVAVIAFTRQHLRQWLAIVFSTYERAQWGRRVFPRWMEEDRNPAPAPKGLLN